MELNWRFICSWEKNHGTQWRLNEVYIGLFNIAMENPPIFKNGKPSISMGHLSHGYVSHNQRVYS